MTWLQICSNGPIDGSFNLIHPDARSVDFDVAVPEGLARTSRYTGHVRAGSYSVAQHSVLGADAIYRKTGDRTAAAAFLLHDAHEHVLGDKATPIAEAEVETAESLVPGAGRIVREMQKLMKRRIDLAIYAAAGLGNDGCPERYRRIVHEYDIGMLATERRHLLGRPPMPWHPSVEAAQPVRLIGKLRVWPWPEAADEFRARLKAYLPDLSAFAPFRPQPKPGPRSAARRIPVEA
jgi:hypothetical protein